MDDKGTVVLKQFGGTAEKTGKDIEQSFDRGSKSVAGMDTSIRNLWITIGGAAALYKLADALQGSIKAASDLQEVSSKFSVVFAGQEQAANRWAQTLVADFNMSKRESREYMGSLQDLLKPMGIVPSVAAKMSYEISKLSADLGSFNNQPTVKVMEDTQSALVGNYETMKKYGVVINETAVKQQALNMGLIQGKEELSAAQKAAAVYTLILAGTTDAQGDVARTAGSYANQVKQAQANIENLRAEIGTNFLPILEKWYALVNKISGGMNKLMGPETMSGNLGTMSETIRGEIGRINNILTNYAGGLSVDKIRELTAELGKLRDQLKTVTEAQLQYVKTAAGDIVSDIRGGGVTFNKDSFVDTGNAAADAAQKTKELQEYLTHVNHSLANLTQQSEEAWYAYDEGATKAVKKTKELDDWLQRATSHLAADESVAGMAKWVQDNFSGATEVMSQDLEHFLDRMEDLFGDTFQRIGSEGLDSFRNLFDNVLNLVTGTFSNQMANVFRTQIFQPMATGGSANWGGLASGIGAAVSGNPIGAGLWGWETIGSMIGIPTPSSLISSIFGGNKKNLQWGLGSGRGLDNASETATAFGRIGAWDKHESIDSAGMKPYLEKVAEVTYKMAEGVQQDVIDQITADMAGWSSGQSAKVTAEGLSGKSLQYLKEISGQLDGWLADLINDWTGSFDELYQYLVGRESTLGQMQTMVDAIVRPVTGIEAINIQFDLMAATAAELHAEQSLLDDIEQGRIKTIQDYTDAQNAANEADRRRMNDMASFTAGSAAGAPYWQQAQKHFQDQYGISFTPDTAKQWYGAYQQNWMNTGMMDQVAASWGMDRQTLITEFEILGRALADYERATTGATSAVDNFAGAASASYDDLTRMAEQMASQWGSIAMSAGDWIQSTMYSSANQASAEERAAGMKQYLRGLKRQGFDTPELAQGYMSGLQQYLGIAQEAYDRPSNEYAKAYEWVIKQMEKLQEIAREREQDLLQIQIDQRDLLAQIAYNTTPGRAAGLDANAEAKILAILRSPRGSATIRDVARF